MYRKGGILLPSLHMKVKIERIYFFSHKSKSNLPFMKFVKNPQQINQCLTFHDNLKYARYN